MSPKGPRRGKFAELVANHVLGHIDRDEFVAVVDRQRKADKIRRNRRAPGPGSQDRFVTGPVHLLHSRGQFCVYEGTLFD